jgi:transcriptional regulator with XRE-family HTH domain
LRGHGTRQTQRPVSPQRTGYAEGRHIWEMRGLDMTQEEFAERIGISQNYLSTMERGKMEIGAESLPTHDQSSYEIARESAPTRLFPSNPTQNPRPLVSHLRQTDTGD